MKKGTLVHYVGRTHQINGSRFSRAVLSTQCPYDDYVNITTIYTKPKDTPGRVIKCARCGELYEVE